MSPRSALTIAIPMIILSVGDGFQPPLGCRSTCSHVRMRNVPRNAKPSKEEMSILAAAMGLQPAHTRKKSSAMGNRTNINTVTSSSKKEQPANMHTSRNGPSHKFQIPIETQLEYSRNGCAVLRSVLDPVDLGSIRDDLQIYAGTKELEAWRQKVEVASNDPRRARACRSIQDCKRELARMLRRDSEALPFLQYFNTWRELPSTKKLGFALGQAASILMDVPSVRLYQDSLFQKRAGDGPTPWHVDARMAPFDTSNMITFWIPLQDIPKDGTALWFVPKSHNDFALPFWNSFDGPEYERLEHRYHRKTVHYMPMNLGDVTVHSGWTLHSANGNYHDHHERRALAITYVDTRAEIRETSMDFAPTGSNNKNKDEGDGAGAGAGGAGYGDNEDQSSYREWLGDVPCRKQFGTHALVPIVWPLP